MAGAEAVTPPRMFSPPAGKGRGSRSACVWHSRLVERVRCSPPLGGGGGCPRGTGVRRRLGERAKRPLRDLSPTCLGFTALKSLGRPHFPFANVSAAATFAASATAAPFFLIYPRRLFGATSRAVRLVARCRINALKSTGRATSAVRS